MDVTSSHSPPASYLDPIPGPGGWIQMAIEDASSLSMEAFIVKYVDTGTPVVLRRSAADNARYPPLTTPDWLRENCDLDGTINNLGQIVGMPSVEWGGFLEDHTKDDEEEEDPDKDSKEQEEDRSNEITLQEYLDYLPNAAELAKTNGGKVYYGFDYNAKCSCPSLLERMPWHAPFRDDFLLLDAASHYGEFVWPSLLVGPAGSSSALHVDNSNLPFHLTLLNGRKLFRAIRLGDWRSKLTGKDGGDGSSNPSYPLYTPEGAAFEKGIDGFDDRSANEEFVQKRGCHVFNATLLPGDTVYVPTGALHGARNLKGEDGRDEPAVAVTSNVFTPAHLGQLITQNCKDSVDTFDFGDGNVCGRLARDRKLGTGVFAYIQNGRGVVDEEGTRYDFWEHYLGRPGFCEKYGDDEEDCPRVVERCKGRSVAQLVSSGAEEAPDDEEL